MQISEPDLVSIFKSNLEYNSLTGEFKWIAIRGNGGSKQAGWFSVREKSSGRAVIQICGKRYEAKRVAWSLHHGSLPNGEIRLISGSSLAICNLADFVRPVIDRRSFSKDYLSEFLEYNHESGEFRWKTRITGSCPEFWFVPKDCGKGAGSIDVFGSRYICTHLAWLLYWGVWPVNEIDHIDGNDQNHRIGNLRDVPHPVNMKNMAIRSDNKTGHAGISVEKKSGRYLACVSINGKTKRIGSFTSLTDAVEARNRESERIGFHENHGRKR